MADEQTKQLENQQPEAKQPETKNDENSFTNIIVTATPIIRDFLQAQVKQMENEEAKDQRNHEFRKASLEREKSKASYQNLFLVIAAIFCGVFISGLAFSLNQVDKAILILSYLGTALLSFFCGYGWGLQTKRTTKE